MTPHFLRYQGLAVNGYGLVLDALNLGCHRLLQDSGKYSLIKFPSADLNLNREKQYFV